MLGNSAFVDHDYDSFSYKQVKPWHSDWMHTEFHIHTNTNAQTLTHAHTARCTPGPLEQALVTPHESI